MRRMSYALPKPICNRLRAPGVCINPSGRLTSWRDRQSAAALRPTTWLWRVADQRAAAEALKQSLSRFGTVRDSSRGLTLVLSESIWANARSSNLLAASAAKLDQIGALLANNPDFQIAIESFTDNRGDEGALQQLTQDRARALSERLAAAGVRVTRIQASGLS